MQDLQTTILKSLTKNETFCRKALPHIKAEYFENEFKPVYQLFLDFLTKYNKLPTSKVLEIEFQQSIYVDKPNATDVLNTGS